MDEKKMKVVEWFYEKVPFLSCFISFYFDKMYSFIDLSWNEAFKYCALKRTTSCLVFEDIDIISEITIHDLIEVLSLLVVPIRTTPFIPFTRPQISVLCVSVVLNVQKDFFSLKEVEKGCSKEKGLNPMVVKEVLQAVIDDRLIDSDKIGSSIFYWAFPSKAAHMVHPSHFNQISTVLSFALLSVALDVFWDLMEMTLCWSEFPTSL